MVEAKDILNWCFTLGALIFGVFGFLYSTYAAASLQAAPVRAPITQYLRYFCRALAFIITLLTAVSIVTSYKTGISLSTWIGFSVWSMVACLAVLTGFSVVLAYKKME